MTILEEKQLKEKIKEMVIESVFDFMQNHESKSNDKEDNQDTNKSNKKATKSRVIDALKSKGIDKAQYAYKLWPEKDKDSARSYFYKCLNHKKNDDGDTYSFDSDEFTKLNTMLTNKQI